MDSELRAWIKAAPFRFAVTMPENPHHYIVQRESGGPEFEAFVRAVKELGSRRRYGGHRYWTIAVDDMTYWLTFGGGAGYIINRKPTAEAGWDDVAPERRAALADLARGISMGLVDDEEAARQLEEIGASEDDLDRQLRLC